MRNLHQTISIVFCCDGLHNLIYGGFWWLQIFGWVIWLLFSNCMFHLFSKMCLMVLMLTYMSLPDLICCKAWNDNVPVGNVLLLFLLWVLQIIESFVVLSCRCCALGFLLGWFLCFVDQFWNWGPLDLRHSPGIFVNLNSLIVDVSGESKSAQQ